MANPGLKTTVELLRQRADIVEIIGEYVSLQRRGRTIVGLCPFHSEKTPSLSVSREHNLFHCFGCKESGSVFDFLMKIENIGFVEAVRMLCARYDLPFPEPDGSLPTGEREKQRQELYRICQLARNFFHNCLRHENLGRATRSYLEQRGIDGKTVDRFGLGFAPDQWQKLTSAFLRRNVSPEQLRILGLIDQARQSDRWYDRFRNRLIVPIDDHYGETVGFGGRALDDSPPKYLNSPESPIFDKGSILFGWHLARPASRAEKWLLVVEGYFDLLQVHAHGIENVVASMGTAFTVRQARCAMRLAERVLFNYDNDDAGLAAVIRAGQLILNGGGQAWVTITDGQTKDPDEYIRRYGIDRYREVLGNALPLYDFLIERARRRIRAGADKTREGRVLLSQLHGLTDEMEIERVLEKASRELMISSQVLRSVYRQGSRRSSSGGRQQTDPGPATMLPLTVRAERELLQALLFDQAARRQWLTDDSRQLFGREESRQLFDWLGRQADFAVDRLSQQVEDGCREELMAVLAWPLATDDLGQQAADCVKRLKLEKLRMLKQHHEQRAMELLAENDQDYLRELATARRISQEIVELNKT
ncbi:MAG: DNA primase [Negativicutes bacterium]|nr:DNA primase [Negativicutes bacterium]